MDPLNGDYLEQLKDAKGYYFGCIDEPGHYVWSATSKRKVYNKFTDWICKMDDLLTTKFENNDGQGLLHQYDGFTILAFHDCSVDTRPGSNSMFIFYGTLSFSEVIHEANINFPEIMNKRNL